MSIQTEVDQTDNSIAIGEGISASFSLLFSNLATAFKLAIMPVISLLIILTITIFFVIQIILQAETNTSPDLSAIHIAGISIAAILLTLIPIQYFAAWVRFLNTGSTSISETFIFNLKKRHFIILGKGLLLNIILYVVLLIIAGIISIAFSASETLTVIALIMTMLLLSVITLRLSYVFPAAALDQPYSFLKSWSDTKGQWLTLLVSFIILSILFLLMQTAFGLVLGAVIAVFGGASSFLMGGLGNPSEILTNLMSITTLIMIIPAYFFGLIITIILYIPFINLHYYCFKKNAGWIDDNKLVDRFS